MHLKRSGSFSHTNRLPFLCTTDTLPQDPFCINDGKTAEYFQIILEPSTNSLDKFDPHRPDMQKTPFTLSNLFSYVQQ